jgi:hypothetical protein
MKRRHEKYIVSIRSFFLSFFLFFDVLQNHQVKAKRAMNYIKLTYISSRACEEASAVKNFYYLLGYFHTSCGFFSLGSKIISML